MVPAVSVLMCVYNGLPYLEQAVESILGQTFTDFEFIIVDDGSTDRGPDLLAGLRDSRVRYVRNTANRGIYASQNRALTLARGRYVAQLDADDLAHADRLGKQAAFLNANPQVGLVAAPVIHIDSLGRPRAGDFRPVSPVIIRWRLLFNNPIIHSSVMYRRDLVLEAGGFNHLEATSGDYELWSRLAGLTELAQFPEPLVRYRIHDRSSSVRSASRQLCRTMDISRRNMAALLGTPPPERDVQGLFVAGYQPRACTRAADLVLQLHRAFAAGRKLSAPDREGLAMDLARRMRAVAGLYLARAPGEAMSVYGRIIDRRLVRPFAGAVMGSVAQRLRNSVRFRHQTMIPTGLGPG